MITACNCTWCQRRSGSVFSVASRWLLEQVVSREGELSTFRRLGTSGGQVSVSFCPTCASTVMTELEALPDVIGIPVGAFADPVFPAPQVAVWCSEKAQWVEFPRETLLLSDQSHPFHRSRYSPDAQKPPC
ncbi:MAG: GFA family protein [Phenylobacterium sp.]|uniref:GFA family protein n=1 Tax=Phenylobacterium sp. TaxID=1871053 RepID=UPI00391A0B6F